MTLFHRKSQAILKPPRKHKITPPSLYSLSPIFAGEFFILNIFDILPPNKNKGIYLCHILPNYSQLALSFLSHRQQLKIRLGRCLSQNQNPCLMRITPRSSVGQMAFSSAPSQTDVRIAHQQRALMGQLVVEKHAHLPIVTISKKPETVQIVIFADLFAQEERTIRISNQHNPD